MKLSDPVTISQKGDLAIVTIDNPPVNATSQAVRAGLLEAVERIEAMPEVAAVVLACAGRTFVAGADITELGKPPREPHLPDVIAAIEASRVPWVAAIKGAAFGGGLEIALGCHGRVAAPGAKLGLPEVTLGIVPGAGGTVRLPRLIAVADALDMITTGKPVSAEKALKTGLVDAVAEDDLLDAASARARALAAEGRPVPLLDRDPVAPLADVDWDAAEALLRKKARGQASPLEALAALRDSATLPAREALTKERARFLRLSGSEEAAALRHVFFSERRAGASLKAAEAAPADLGHVGVIGGGTMGAGIAAALLLSGSLVSLIERDEASCAAAAGRITGILEGSHKRGLLDDAGLADATARLETGSDYAALTPCELVIEAVFEDMDVKTEVFARLDAIMAPDAILASNTSYLDVNALAARTARPARVIGLHFFSPAHVMKLLEVVRTDGVSDRALATAGALAKRLRKTPVVAGVCDGFIGNRIMSAYRRECDFMLEEGALPWQIDAAMRGFGFAMGIYAVQDMAGLDVAWAMRKRRAATRPADERYSRIADRLCEMGRFGRKTGAGWYNYEDSKPVPDPLVEGIILEESERLGIARREFSEADIVARIMSLMQAEAQAVLDEGIAESASDIDVTMILGYGFPRHKGGPMFLAGRV
ncbi:3-hydroxyacyl-CoA dehydrogenase NAD-binding domain-containing protein [Stappia indica]|uniref:3-hydroxyacyl-CoA dehydrogenase NAD-binding domain-containing protein n=1 Tax=Stappia indica TaxID=538381 RepID=UPI001CD40B72|nr:3-hydroxyacyl-CoA dehydrogenase NAD-binding domain-containing protein [Stappia indica]MCA1297077.1 enoyl-CoA hydratase/isomerase family protein [Stappia indica]